VRAVIKGRTLIALVLPVVCTGAFWLVLPAAYRASESSDFPSFYEPVAVRLLAGQGITTESGAVAMRYPPGYPIVLAAAIGAGRALGLSEEHALDVLALACVAISSLLLHLIARDIWSGWAALVPSAAWSTYPLALWLTKQPNSELVFTPLLFACAFALWKITRDVRPRAGMVLAVGACAGAAMLVRPIALFLPLVCGALVLVLAKEWSVRARAVTAASVLAVALLVVLPWELRASGAAGHFVMLSDGGVPTMRDGLTFAVNAKKDYRAGIRVPDAVRTVMISFYAQYDQLDSYGAIARAMLAESGRHPAGMAGLVVLKLVRAWYGTDSQRLEGYIAVIQLVYLALLAWAWYVARCAGGERKRLAFIVASILILFWCMSVLALPLVRHMVPAIGMAFVLLPAAREKVVR
jgi:4-amino-4-deoxy-L-arabinose transferase-like glycosyltransferase